MTFERSLLAASDRSGRGTEPGRLRGSLHDVQRAVPTFGEPGFFGARLGRYLAERARGGAGTIIAGQAQVHPTTAYQMQNNAAAWDEAAIPHFRAADLAGEGARRARLPPARAQRRRQSGDRGRSSRRGRCRRSPNSMEPPKASRAARDPRARRVLRALGANADARRLRRHRGARRARVSHPRVPLAAPQPPHRRVRWLAREPACASRSRS